MILEGREPIRRPHTIDSPQSNTVEGSSFPNWIGDVRTTKELTLTVQGDRMTKAFHQPGGAKGIIVWERASD